jgi:cytidylate kinase
MSRKIINITGLANTGKNKLSNDLGDVYKCNIINGNIFKMFENFKISMGNENSK